MPDLRISEFPREREACKCEESLSACHEMGASDLVAALSGQPAIRVCFLDGKEAVPPLPEKLAR